MKREKSTRPRTDPCGAPRRARKERLSPTSKARREAIRNKFMEKGGVPDKVDSSQIRPRTRPGFVKLIRNGLKKIKNWIKSKSSRAETGLPRRKNEFRWKRVGVSELLRGRRSEEMTQLNTSSSRGRKYSLSPRGDDGI